jgi:WD40 repeat protein
MQEAGSGHTPATATATPPAARDTSEADMVDDVKGRLSELDVRDAELLTVIAEHTLAIEQAIEKRGVVRANKASAESELDVLVNAPVSGGRDPTEWLPDELMLMIMERMPFKVLWSRVCERVCQRWARLAKCASLRRRMRVGRWAAYKARVIKPRELEFPWLDEGSAFNAIAVGLDGKVYSGSEDCTVKVSSADGAHLQTLEGHKACVDALAVGLDGKVYSSSESLIGGPEIRVWSGEDGRYIETLKGTMCAVAALAVGLDGKVYAGSWDGVIRVWSGDDGKYLHTINSCDGDDDHGNGNGVVFGGAVRSLAVGLDGKLYAGTQMGAIHVWSSADNTHIHTLKGHTTCVGALAVGLDGKVYSGSEDGTIRAWSGDDGAHLQTFESPRLHKVLAIAVGLDGEVFSASGSSIQVWRCSDGVLLHRLRGKAREKQSGYEYYDCYRTLAVTTGGRLFSGGAYDTDDGWSNGLVEMW